VKHLLTETAAALLIPIVALAWAAAIYIVFGMALIDLVTGRSVRD
jgi:hypothetical protein